MRTVLSFVVASLLLAPATALASPLTFLVSDGGDLAVSFGLVRFEMSSEVESEDSFLIEGVDEPGQRPAAGTGTL